MSFATVAGNQYRQEDIEFKLVSTIGYILCRNELIVYCIMSLRSQVLVACSHWDRYIQRYILDETCRGNRILIYKRKWFFSICINIKQYELYFYTISIISILQQRAFVLDPIVSFNYVFVFPNLFSLSYIIDIPP